MHSFQIAHIHAVGSAELFLILSERKVRNLSLSYVLPWGPNYPHFPASNTLNLCLFFLMWQTKFRTRTKHIFNITIFELSKQETERYTKFTELVLGAENKIGPLDTAH
jgi:hypothetical protein